MKLLKIFLISGFIIILLSSNVFALGDTFSMAEDWESKGKENTNLTMDTSKLQDSSKKLYNMLLAVAVGVAVIVGAILAVQFMTAGINKKVEVKEALFPYLISCGVVFSAMGIWKLVVTIMSDM